MSPYIYGRRNSIHIVDIRETLRGLLRARKFLSRLVAGGGEVLFVGTKRQARETIQRQAERCGMHYVIERWLGGTLTNFRTIRSRLQRLEELEALVGTPQWETGYSKKMKSTLTRELRKIKRNLEGIRKMERLPGALVVIDVRKEVNALREARNVGIPTVCLVDTDSDPDYTSIAIPGNDDGMRGIELVLGLLADAVEEGRRARPAAEPQTEPLDSVAPGAARRRKRRTTTGSLAEPLAVEEAEVIASEPAREAPVPTPQSVPAADSDLPDAAAVAGEPESTQA